MNVSPGFLQETMMDAIAEKEESNEFFPGEPEMNSCCLGDLVIITNTRGALAMADIEYPARYGLYGEIRTGEFSFHFNISGEIRYMRGLTHRWPHPWEWLKRTWGNDWVYYSAGLGKEQGRVKDWMGENYIPCLSYESNAIRELNPYTEPGIARAFSAWSQVYGTLCCASSDNLPEDIKAFLTRVIVKNEESRLIDQTLMLHDIIGGRVSVLPPDTRHVDYEVIPLNIADGCLYRCRFCSVKTGDRFKVRSREAITRQIAELKDFYGSNLRNLNSIFMGGHDALAAGVDLIAFAANKAFSAFGFNHSGSKIPSLFLFGSVGSFLRTNEAQFKILNRLSCKIYINLGLEAFDEPTLEQLGKPITPAMVYDSLCKMVHINESFSNIELSANFLLGTGFSKAHHDALIDLLASLPEKPGKKGCVYLSPLVETQHRDEVLPMFYEIKRQSVLPAYIYLIQRL